MLLPTAGLAVLALVAACGGGDTAGTGDGSTEAGGDGEVTLEFQQWWEPELPDGEFRALIDRFEEENPGITVELLSGPYASTKEQVVAGAAAGTMPDVVGLDGAWVYDFAQQGAIADLSELMTEVGYDDSELASQIEVDGATYMIPVVNFVYPLFTNDALLADAGVSEVPTTRSEFTDAAKKITDSGTPGWIYPLSLEQPSGIQNNVMSWVWASGGSMLADGQPDLTNEDVGSALEFLQGMWDDGSTAPGAFTMKEQDMVEEFTNGRVGMMIDSLAHVNLIRESNPDLDFTISAIPAEDGYDGERGIPYASWGIGVADNSENKEEAFKLVEFLMSQETNSELSTMANAFPGNSTSTPDFTDSDPIFEEAFAIYQEGYPANEFTGLPVAEELMRMFSTEFQKALNGDQSLDEAVETAQAEWSSEF
ncbi:ABC transporter substrate-binding protein [Serinibacter arcticus]|uniref:ABC transporter substrate-binding protein n=1 Tax=Serinibacter arcticus TaxID=1655435 RepID=UPI001E5BD736|nr:sugar ABC transporter substrate-binding protein [Serinibacter arcticus]